MKWKKLLLKRIACLFSQGIKLLLIGIFGISFPLSSHAFSLLNSRGYSSFVDSPCLHSVITVSRSDVGCFVFVNFCGVVAVNWELTESCSGGGSAPEPPPNDGEPPLPDPCTDPSCTPPPPDPGGEPTP